METNSISKNHTISRHETNDSVLKLVLGHKINDIGHKTNDTILKLVLEKFQMSTVLWIQWKVKNTVSI